MNEHTKTLASALIRNFNKVRMDSFVREPLYEGQSARLAPGTVAQKLGATIDILAPGKRGCPYHLHHAQEEMFSSCWREQALFALRVRNCLSLRAM